MKCYFFNEFVSGQSTVSVSDGSRLLYFFLRLPVWKVYFSFFTKMNCISENLQNTSWRFFTTWRFLITWRFLFHKRLLGEIIKCSRRIVNREIWEVNWIMLSTKCSLYGNKTIQRRHLTENLFKNVQKQTIKRSNVTVLIETIF